MSELDGAGGEAANAAVGAAASGAVRTASASSAAAAGAAGYETVRELGHGGFGSARVALRLSTRELVVIKAVPARTQSEVLAAQREAYEAALADARREAQQQTYELRRDLLSLRAADVTDDGRVEAIVTVRRTVTLTVQGVSNTSQRDMVFAYSFEPSHRGRIFAVEVARRSGEGAIVNRLVLPSGRRGNGLAVETGEARGWTRETYPFHDAPPQGYEALSLPWEGPPRTVWRWGGSSMTRVP
jgi:hypothetical protein